MPLLILGFILAVPIIELMVLVEVGSNIGAFSAVALTVLTAIVGLSLVRQQGLRVVSQMQAAAAAGEPVGDKMVHGFFLAIAGVFLFFPGFITDFIGALFLIPFIRQLLGGFVVARLVANARTTHFHQAETGPEDDVTVVYTSLENEEQTVETQFWHDDDENKPKD